MSFHNTDQAVCQMLDNIINGKLKSGETTLIYGETSTGKTTFAIQCAVNFAKKGLRTLFIDADNTFSPNRLSQIVTDNLTLIAPLILILKPQTFREQATIIQNLPNYNLNTISLIVIDTITNLYQMEFATTEKIITLNMELNWQLAHLNELTKSFNIKLLLISHVHSLVQDNIEERTEPLAHRVLKHWSKTIINLENMTEPAIKKATVKKGEIKLKDNSCFYTISGKGIVLSE